MTAHKSRKIHLTVLSKLHFITKHIIQYTIRKKILVIKKKKKAAMAVLLTHSDILKIIFRTTKMYLLITNLLLLGC